MDFKTVVLSLLLGAVGGMATQVVLNMLPPVGLSVPGQAGIMQAQEFQAVSKDSKASAVMGVTASGQPFVRLKDKQGVVRAQMQLTQQQLPIVRLYDDAGASRAFMLVDERGMPLVGVADREGKSGTLLEMSENDKPALVLRHNNKMKGLLCVSKVGPSLDLMDDDGNLRAVIGQAELKNETTGSEEITPVGSVVLFDKVGNVIYRLPHSATSAPAPSATHSSVKQPGGVVLPPLPSGLPSSPTGDTAPPSPAPSPSPTP